MSSVRLENVPREVTEIPIQPASRDIWDKKYRLKTKSGEVLDKTVDDTWKRIARALAEVEETGDKQRYWYERFLWALRRGVIPAGRITSNAGAWEHKPATSTINCTVSGTIQDSMDGILDKVHEAGLTLKAGCVAPGTWVMTEHGLVTADRAVAEQHREILSYDRDAGRYEMRPILEHMTTHVPHEDNIRIHSNGVTLTTSVRHPVLVYRDGRQVYVRADEVRETDALVHHAHPWTAAEDRWLEAWFAGAHLGDGSAYPKHMHYKPTRQAWAQRAQAMGQRLIFKIRAAEHEVVERYRAFFQAFCGAQAKVVEGATPHGTPVWDDTVASFEASRAAKLIDNQIGRKTDTLRVPAWVKARPEKHFLPFLAGLVDTDGTVAKERGAVSITTQSHEFAAELKSLLGLFGVHGAITVRKPHTHMLNGREVHDRGGAILKISDSDFLQVLADYMADTGKRERIRRYASQAGMYDVYHVPESLRDALTAENEGLSHTERQSLGFYHGYHRRERVSRIWLERWRGRFPHLEPLIEFARRLRPVERVERGLDLPETFYDFTVEGHNNYLAGNDGLMVIHNCGIGYEFSTLRPRGAYVSGAGAYTSGPLSFMDIYDKMCFTVSSAGGRRGAQMATFDVGHPDVIEFIRAKRENGRLRQFNMSLLITDEFMEAVKNNREWPLAFPLDPNEAGDVDLEDPKQVIWRDWPSHEHYITNDLGQVACRVYKTVKARGLWDVIMTSTYDYAEPGFILIDRVNELNNNWWCENIRATNPCGEQPLPPYGSCWTGAMRLNTNHGLIRTDDAYALVQQGKPLMIGVDDQFSGNRTNLRPCTLVRNGEKEVFDIRFANGQRIELTADHRVHTPDGWKEVRELATGSEVHVQSCELSHLSLVDPFDLGTLKFLFERHEGDQIVITRKSRRTLARAVLDRLKVNFCDRAKGLFVSRNHAVVREVSRCNLALAEDEVLRGYVYAALTTAARYKGQPCAYGDAATMAQLARAQEQLGASNVRVIRHKRDTFRVLLDASLDIRGPRGQTAELDLNHALYGWLLADGWLTESAGVLFSDTDDVAMQLLAPQFKALTGTDGTLRKSYVGQTTDVHTIACYRKEAVRKLRNTLGLDHYSSRDLRVPEKIFRANSRQQASFLAAVFCADGGISDDKLSIRLVSASRGWLEDIQLLLLNFGIHGMINANVSKGNAFYSLLLRQADAYSYFRHIGFPFCSGKQERLERLLTTKQRWHEPDEYPSETIAAIVSKGIQPVYDIEEFSTHTLIVNGIVVHNCLLGSVNLTKFVHEPFTDKAWFDHGEYKEAVRVFTRMLDNVVEINGLPLGEQRNEIYRKRRHGMGFLGLGSTLTMLRQKYGSPESLEFTESVARDMAVAGWEASLELAKEKGPAPIMEEAYTVTKEMLAKRPEMASDGWKEGQKIQGKVLHARYSRYMQRVAEVAPELVEELAEFGGRFTHHTSIAPTGTISLSLANNASNGIEPSFAHHYFRNVIREGKKSKEKVDVFSFEMLAYREMINRRAMPVSDDPAEQLPDYFITAEDITPKEHVDIQAAAQKWIDSSISKTANVPTDYPYEDFKGIYHYAYENDLKGCTTFRFNPEAFQGVLVKETDLANTTYRFTLGDGTVVEAKGNEEIEYDGEIHTAANLYDALKEGYYGKF